MDDQRAKRFNMKRTLRMALGLAVFASAAMGISVWASTAPTVPPNAAQIDQQLEDENGGVPAVVVRRRDEVLAELATKPADEWAGEYFEGDGLGVNSTLYLGAKSGVAATWFGCMGLYGANEGNVERTGDKTLAFHFSKPNPDRWLGSFPDAVRTVRWGQRRYLIPQSRQIDFVNAINRGMEPGNDAHSMFLLARGDHDKPVWHLPDLPDTLLALIRRTPVVIRVLSVAAETEKRRSADFATCTFRMRMAVPEGVELVPGLDFESTDARMYDTATVVEANGPEVVATMISYDACADVEHKPVVGSEFTSGTYVPLEGPDSR